MKELFLQISNRQDLTQEQVQEVFDQILQNQLSESQIAAFLMGLKTKGEKIGRASCRERVSSPV